MEVGTGARGSRVCCRLEERRGAAGADLAGMGMHDAALSALFAICLSGRDGWRPPVAQAGERHQVHVWVSTSLMTLPRLPPVRRG
jgi:hypothetical protein